MALPPEHLHYKMRRYGMDHDRYDWSMAPERKAINWPGGARLALWVVPALEFFPLNAPAKPFKAPGSMVTPYPDLRHYTLRDYGSRVGIFRVMKVLDDLGVRASVTVNAHLAERYPLLIDQVNARGWEIIANGLDMGALHHGGLAEDEERALVQRSLETLRRISGQAVTGWLSPARSESFNTLDLVAAEGIDYVCDWVNDELPYPLKTKHGAIYAMPHSQELSDQTIIFHYKRS
jgi:peptidoglycan/xylan/chitin deacetylase (PgdA/CDA1 family)